MFLGTGIDYYVVPLEGIDIVCKSGAMIRSPLLKVKLLSYPDFNKVELLIRSGRDIDYIYEEVCNHRIESIIGYEQEEIDFNESPAGVLLHIGKKLLDNSRIVLEDLVKSYEELSNSVTLLEQISMIVANHSNHTYEYTKSLPIDELIKRYAICSATFNYAPIQNEEENSRVG